MAKLRQTRRSSSLKQSSMIVPVLKSQELAHILSRSLTVIKILLPLVSTLKVVVATVRAAVKNSRLSIATTSG